jgi:hypothetical protein
MCAIPLTLINVRTPLWSRAGFQAATHDVKSFERAMADGACGGASSLSGSIQRRD